MEPCKTNAFTDRERLLLELMRNDFYDLEILLHQMRVFEVGCDSTYHDRLANGNDNLLAREFGLVAMNVVVEKTKDLVTKVSDSYSAANGDREAAQRIVERHGDAAEFLIEETLKFAS